MHRFGSTCLLFVGILGMAVRPAAGREEFLRAFLTDPFQLNEEAACGSCHTSDTGGDALNEFGSAFDDAGQEITPLLRASFPTHFGFYSTKLADGSAFHFSDPKSQFVVFERAEEKHVIDIEALTAKPENVIPKPVNRLSFFITSVGKGNGGHLEGLAGADRHCQELAAAVGIEDESWRAYLSTSFGERPAVNAGDRIGDGPWFNAKGRLIARGVADLHRDGALAQASLLNEKGEPVVSRGDGAEPHPGVDILTGSHADGTAAVGKNCENWTSSSGATAMVGHFGAAEDGDGGAPSWNSAHESEGCGPELGEALFYCFALR